MEQLFVPSCCSGEDATHTGVIKLKPLSYDARLDIYEEIGFEQTQDQKEAYKQHLKVLKYLGKRSGEFVSEVKLSRLTDGKSYSSWEEVYHDSEMVSLVTEVCGRILGKM